MVEASGEKEGSDDLLDTFLGCIRELAKGSKVGFYLSLNENGTWSFEDKVHWVRVEST